MDDLSRLVSNARTLVLEGYYGDLREEARRAPSLLETLGTGSQASCLIAEIKYASPTRARGPSADGFAELLDRLVRAKPLGLSVLAEPHIFGGSLDFVRAAAERSLPVLFKDIVVDPVQIEAAAATGASAVLLIQTLFTRALVPGDPQAFLDEAHEHDLDVVLEVHTPEEWDAASKTDADILGVNNRDLATMTVDLGTTPRILGSRRKDRPVIAMSGIETRAQVETMLRAGADAVLVGTSIMAHEDPGRKLEELQHG